VRKSDYKKSRRKTPWDGVNDLNPTQAFLKENYDARYNKHHRKVADSGEAEMVNYYTPVRCPFCNSEKFKKKGYNDSGVQRYICACSLSYPKTQIGSRLKAACGKGLRRKSVKKVSQFLQ
jgi:hypothetical protein